MAQNLGTTAPISTWAENRRPSRAPHLKVLAGAAHTQIQGTA